MEEIKDYLHIHVLTITDKILGDNLEEFKNSGYYEGCYKYLDQKCVKKKMF